MVVGVYDLGFRRQRLRSGAAVAAVVARPDDADHRAGHGEGRRSPKRDKARHPNIASLWLPSNLPYCSC
jgi:hypothetical protein